MTRKERARAHSILDGIVLEDLRCVIGSERQDIMARVGKRIPEELFEEMGAPGNPTNSYQAKQFLSYSLTRLRKRGLIVCIHGVWRVVQI